MFKIASSVAAVLLSLLSFAISLPSQAEESLGLGVTIENDNSGGDLYMGNRLWFGIEPGTSKSRSFRVLSRSAIQQDIEFDLVDVSFVNGVRQLDFGQDSETLPWLSFEPAELTLEPGEEQVVTMTYSVPEGAEEVSFDSVLRVSATSTDLTSGNDDASTAVVRGAAAIDLDVWLGIGDALSLVPAFNIDSVRGWKLPDGDYLEVEFANTGNVPVQLTGTAQLADPVFAERNFGPFAFYSNEIFPGDRGVARILMPADVLPGDWKIFVTAEYGQIRQTRLFEQELNFIIPGSEITLWDWVIRLLLIGLLSSGLVVGVRLLRSEKHKPLEEEIAVAKAPEVRVPDATESKSKKPRTAATPTSKGAVKRPSSSAATERATVSSSESSTKKLPSQPKTSAKPAATKTARTSKTGSTKSKTQAARPVVANTSSSTSKKSPQRTKNVGASKGLGTTKEQVAKANGKSKAKNAGS